MTRLLACILALVALSSGVCSAQCFELGVDPRGVVVYSCNNHNLSLPLCGSPFDTGSQCIVVRPQISRPPFNHPGGWSSNGGVPQQFYTGRNRLPFQRGGGVSPGGFSGSPPVNAGGSWPNRAYEYSQGRR